MVVKNIGEILVDQGVITRAQLDKYVSESVKAGSDLESYVLNNKLVQEDALLHARAAQFNLPHYDTIAEKMTDAELLGKVPLKFLRENMVMPIKDETGQIIIVAVDPLNYQAIDELDMIFGGRTKRALAAKSTVIDAINKYYPLEGTKEMIEELEEDKELSEVGLDFGTIKEEDILGMASEAPIIKLVNHVLYQAVKKDASDIHIEPFEKELHIRYRIDGTLYPAMIPPKRAQAAIISRIKIMANLNIAEKRQPQGGRILIKIADKPFEIRVSVLPVVYGERVVMRLLDKSKSFSILESLGFSERDYHVISQSIAQPNGIILITGPTGSGKTTTLYSILTKLNKPDVNILTVEDPVEYQIQGVGQVEVKEQIGLTFAAVLRTFLRQDPDIIMVGETRDPETAQISIQAALTGHLVLSTIHTNSAAATITRLLDMGIDPYLIASTVSSITAQRLVRVLCPHCKKEYVPSADLLKRLGMSEKDARSVKFFKPVGCDECLKTGYHGRMAIFEIMVMSPAIAKMTMDRVDSATIQRQAVKEGMTLLIDDGIRKIKMGLTTIEEVLAAATSSFEPEL